MPKDAVAGLSASITGLCIVEIGWFPEFQR
jgi:hypothetical protein